jgi:plasmid stabilization system protein ParE
MTGYDFHPEAEIDLDEIWEYIAAESLPAADRVIAEIHQRLEGLVPFPHLGIADPI